MDKAQKERKKMLERSAKKMERNGQDDSVYHYHLEKEFGTKPKAKAVKKVEDKTNGSS